ncbi:MAG: hypothetical protein R3F43_15790 [bacterium]
MTDDQRAAADLVLVNAGKALAAFERRLLSFDAPFDRYLAALAARDADGLAALTDSARRGLALFVGDAGCVACHRGPALSDGDFHDIGLPPIAGRPVDPGRSGALADVRADPRNAAGRYSDDPAGDRALRLGDLDFDLGTPGRFKTPPCATSPSPAPGATTAASPASKPSSASRPAPPRPHPRHSAGRPGPRRRASG